jgi:hypothetical protein
MLHVSDPSDQRLHVLAIEPLCRGAVEVDPTDLRVVGEERGEVLRHDGGLVERSDRDQPP